MIQRASDQNNSQSLRVVGIHHRPNLRPLSQEEIRFEIDMCIGCDRCMHACPVPLSSSINIAELNSATITDMVSPHVQRFTDECVMCGSCVSVCPVNNHRDLLMLSLKQRMGIVWDGQVDMNRIFQYLPPGWDIQSLIGALRDQPMFRDEQLVPDKYLLHMVVTSKFWIVPRDTVIFHEGEFGRSLYLILYGRIALLSIGESGEEMQVALARRGEYIGEHGLITGLQYTETARVLSASVVLEVPERVIQSLMEIVPSLRAFFDAVHNTRSVEAIMKRMALFQGVSEVDVRAVAQLAVIKCYERDERVFGENPRWGATEEAEAGPLFPTFDSEAYSLPVEQEADSRPDKEVLHLVMEGFVKVARATELGTGRDKGNERIIAYRQCGDYFVGGLDLLGDGRAVTVTAITRVRVAEVPRKIMLALFTQYPEVGYRFQSQLLEYIDTAALAQTSSFDPFTNAEARAGLRALVGGGVVEGTEVLIIDLDKCIHCNECEEACARRHGHSRMSRNGMVVGNVMITTACRHCQDPVCMLCSRAGIARHPSGEIYITDTCIGCGICAERCPYDNISIMTVEEENNRLVVGRGQAPSLQERFNAFFAKAGGKERGRKVLPVVTFAEQIKKETSLAPENPVEEMRKKVAIKCDLCAGYENQACVQACPTGAALRVQPAQFFGSTENILRQRKM
jgi:Fe-S-cluster-containing hydrogenase component 2/CRP-like cAMP-binding protein